MGRKGSWFSAIKKVFTSNSKDKLHNDIEKKTPDEKKKGRVKSRNGENRSFIPLFREPSSIEKILGEVDQLLYIGHPTPVHQPEPPPPPESIHSVRSPSPRVGGSYRVASPRAASPRSSPPRAAHRRTEIAYRQEPTVRQHHLSATLIQAAYRGYMVHRPGRCTRSLVKIGFRTPILWLSRLEPFDRFCKYTYRNGEDHKSRPLQCESFNSNVDLVSYGHSALMQRELQCESFNSNVDLVSYGHSTLMLTTYLARRSFRALRGLVRLQGVIRGQNVKRQTMNAMKQMQLLVRVQTQIQSRRIQTLENQTLERQTYKNEKEVENSIGKWTFSNLLEMGDEHWDDSLITKEEQEARMQRKMEAVIKRERAMAYAYSNQLWKATPKSAQNALTDIRSGGFPWWWNWLERQLPADETPIKNRNPELTPTPPRTNLDRKTSPRPQSSIFKQSNFSFENLDTPTPKSSRSMVPTRGRTLMTPTRTPPSTTPNLIKYSKPKGSAAGSPYPMKDDDSLMSCPPFSVPNYMSPTVSAKAKARPTGNLKDRMMSAAASETSSKRRFSFPLTQNIGASFKWNKKSSSKDLTASQAPIVLEKHKSPRSIGDLSMDSAISMPAAFGRRPFNRFV